MSIKLSGVPVFLIGREDMIQYILTLGLVPGIVFVPPNNEFPF